jgi:hypothetical protein
MLVLYETTLDRMEEAFHRLAAMIEPPELVARGSHHVFRYRNETAEAAVIQKLARTISGLRATLLLLRNGYVQEIGALCRMLDEFNEDIVFLCQAIGKDRISELHQKYLAAFYEEEFDDPDRPILSNQKRPAVPRSKIHAAIASIAEYPLNPSDGQQLHRTLHRANSGYVHAASGHILEMYGGDPPRYHLSGMLGTPRVAELTQYLWNYFYRGFVSLMFCAVAFRNKTLVDELYAFRDQLERASGRTQWVDPNLLIRRAKERRGPTVSPPTTPDG